MTTKVKLLEKIQLIDNDHCLEAILEYLEDSERTPISLSEDDVLYVKKSDQQISKGNFITQNELKNKIDGWDRKI